MTRRSSIVTWCVALGVLTAAAPARATIIVGNPDNPQPPRHDRFYVGDDKAFIGDPYDFSGVGRVDTTGYASRWVTMISPSYFLSATHWDPAEGATVKFHHTNDPDGAAELRTVVSGVRIGASDVWLGKLSSPVSSSVAKYPLLEFHLDRDYDDLEILTFGLTVQRIQGTATTVRLGRNEINPGEYGVDPDPETGGEYYRYEYDDPGLVDDESYLQVGDSGGPSFTIYDAQPALTGIHWRIDEDDSRDFSDDSFLKRYVADIQAAMIGERPSVLPTPPNVWTWGNQGGGGDSQWANAANWEPGQVPKPRSVSTIGNGDTVTLDTDGRSAEVVLNHGWLHLIDDGTLTVDDVVEVGPASWLTVDGSLSANTVSVHGTLAGGGTVHAESIDVLGAVLPGNSDIGTLTVGGGEMTLAESATYEAELSLVTETAGAGEEGGADVIEVTTDATLQLGGTLALRGVERDNGDWASGVIRRVVDNPTGTITGTFLPDDAASHVGQGAFLRNVHYVPDDAEPSRTTGVDVELFIAWGGDVDGDGMVGLDDWDTFRTNFGSSGTGWTGGNFNPWVDDNVGLDDWDTLRAHFGTHYYTFAEGGSDGDADTPLQSASGSSVPAGSAAGRSIPEPAALAMLLGAGLLGIGVVVRQRFSARRTA